MKKLVDGKYISLTQQQIKLIYAEEDLLLPYLVRSQRDNLLAQSDVHALADRITPEWASYRQALRDITEQAGFPNNITWPVRP